MENAPKDLINEILGLSNANLLLRAKVAELSIQVEQLRLQLYNTGKIPGNDDNQTPPMEKI
jgi:hypothetical protein